MNQKHFIFPAEELLRYSYRELREVLTGEFYLQFEDGILFTNDRETILTMPLWDWIRKRPIKLQMKHHLSHAISKKMFNKNTHAELLSVIHWDIYDAYKKNGRFSDQDLLEELTEEIYEHSNVFYNLLCVWMEEEIATVTIGDIIKLFDVKEIDDILAAARPTEESVLGTTRAITTLFGKSLIPAIKNNIVIRYARAGVVKLNQLVQAVAPTGYIEGIDGSIFPNPLMSNYTDGHRSLHDNMVESCKASQAIEATKSELEDAVYQSRRQEILNQILMTIHSGDCGSKHYKTTRLKRDNGLTATDLELMVGKLYFLPGEDASQLKKIQLTDEHLYDAVIHMRTITHCAHFDSNGVCETCLGGMAETIPRKTNLGQIMTTDLYAFLIQRQLSKKHYLANSIVQRLNITGDDLKYLAVGRDGVSYHFTDQLQGSNFKVIISYEEGKTLTDLMYLEDLRRVAISRLTNFRSMSIETDNGVYIDRRGFIVGTAKRPSSFSHDMLEYIKEVSWERDSNDNFIIDMSKWDTSKPFAYVPMKNDSLIDFSINFKNHIESDVKKEELRDQFTDPDTFLEETYEILNKELTINHAQVEVAVYGIMIQSALNSEYALPKPWHGGGGIGVMNKAMALRSLGGGMAFENHSAIFSSTSSFIVTNRPDTVMDCVLHPGELIHDVDGTGQIYSRDNLPRHLEGRVF